ncbi:Leucine-rich repeat-containing protein 51 [Boothiomyces sp. JEL0866]|nr:Leucine-rich repeat-containing protein 51 [Boothiomyces sp. JEL0866]
MKTNEHKISAREDTLILSPPVDFSFHELHGLLDLCEEESEVSLQKQPRKRSNSIRFCNNHLQSISELPRILTLLKITPETICWIDFSFNNLTKVEDAILTCANMKVLYLHANDITAINEVDKLGKLRNLRNLTLHGNPLEATKGYRFLVLSKIPQLKHLDFCAITKGDHVVVRTCYK